MIQWRQKQQQRLIAASKNLQYHDRMRSFKNQTLGNDNLFPGAATHGGCMMLKKLHYMTISCYIQVQPWLRPLGVPAPYSYEIG